MNPNNISDYVSQRVIEYLKKRDDELLALTQREERLEYILESAGLYEDKCIIGPCSLCYQGELIADRNDMIANIGFCCDDCSTLFCDKCGPKNTFYDKYTGELLCKICHPSMIHG